MRICEFCEKIKNKRNLLYEDKYVYAMLGSKPSSKGHMMVMPKEHYTILEHVPDDIFTKTFMIANSLLTLAFKRLGAKGGNLLIRNGVPAGQDVPHFAIHVIPRYDDDSINLHWDPQKFPDDKMIKYQNAIKHFLKPPQKQEEVRVDYEVKENYLHSQLMRRP